MPKANSQRLAEIMSERRLDAETIARLTHRSPHTVISWLRPETAKAHRNMPDWAMDMLEMKLAIEKHKGTQP